MEEQDILDVQLVQKISRGTARQQYYARYPERGVSYASTVTQTGACSRVTTEGASLANIKGTSEINIEQEEWRNKPWQLREEETNAKKIDPELIVTTSLARIMSV